MLIYLTIPLIHFPNTHITDATESFSGPSDPSIRHWEKEQTSQPMRVEGQKVEAREKKKKLIGFKIISVIDLLNLKEMI